jgi:hypothetical protein
MLFFYGGKLKIMKLGYHDVRTEFYEGLLVCLKINKDIPRHKHMILPCLFLYIKPLTFFGVGGMDTFFKIPAIGPTYPTP